MTKYGYARVSTNAQSLSEQVEVIQNEGVIQTNIYQEKFTGTKTDRPKFNQVLQNLKPHDELIVTKLDRLARNSREALEIIEPLLDQEIEINVLNLGKLSNTTMGKLTYQVLLAVAEMERNMIVERTQAGKKYAKIHNPNYREGRPKRIINKHYQAAYNYLISGHSYKETADNFGISKNTVYRIKKQIENNNSIK